MSSFQNKRQHTFPLTTSLVPKSITIFTEGGRRFLIGKQGATGSSSVFAVAYIVHVTKSNHYVRGAP